VARNKIALAEIDSLHSWQRSALAAVTVSNDRTHAEQMLQVVGNDSANILGSMLAFTGIEWL
jgi:uncharacterized protein YlxP (DUF503 family)